MPPSARICLLACVGVALLGGCGGSNEDATIPARNADNLLSLLTGIETNADGRCEIARGQADDFKAQVDLLPAAVDDTVKQGLFEIADNLERLTGDPSQCTDAGGTSGPTGVLEPTTTETETTTTETEPTTTDTTTETEPTTTETGPTTTTPDGGNGGPSNQPPPTGGGTGNGPTSGGIGGEKRGAR